MHDAPALAVGDEEFQRKCFDHLYSLRRAGKTIIVVSHGLGQLGLVGMTGLAQGAGQGGTMLRQEAYRGLAGGGVQGLGGGGHQSGGTQSGHGRL